MAWILLIVAGLFEVGWAIGLKYTDGFSRPLPTAWTLAAMVIEQTTTLGVRLTPVSRRKAGRRIEAVETPWGTARVKLKEWRGRVIAATPEYDDLAALAAATGLPIATVSATVTRLAERFLAPVTNETG